MIPVKFIQFIQPYGRQKEITIDLSDDLASKLELIKNSGCRLTAEVLSTGVISFCIELTGIADVEIELCANGPGVKEAIAKMLDRFSLERLEEFKKELAA